MHDPSPLRRFLFLGGAALLAAALFYLTVRYLLPWLLPFVPALLLAEAAEPAVAYLRRKLRLRRGFTALILTLLLLALSLGALALLGTVLLTQAKNLLGGVPQLAAALRAALTRAEEAGRFPAWITERIDLLLARGDALLASALSALMPRLLAFLAQIAAALPRVALGMATGVLAFYFTVSSYSGLRAAMRCLPAGAREALNRLRCGVLRSAVLWLRAELTLLAVTFAELLLGFFLMRERYALLLALLITLLDALPVFGTGTALVPWAAVSLLLGNVPRAAALAALHLITLSVRSALEPRLLGRGALMPPLLSLAAMYLGFRTFGLWGMLLFPFLLMLAGHLLLDGEKNGAAAGRAAAPKRTL